MRPIWTLERGIDGQQIEIFARGCVFVKVIASGNLKCLSRDVGCQLTNPLVKFRAWHAGVSDSVLSGGQGQGRARGLRVPVTYGGI